MVRTCNVNYDLELGFFINRHDMDAYIGGHDVDIIRQVLEHQAIRLKPGISGTHCDVPSRYHQRP